MNIWSINVLWWKCNSSCTSTHKHQKNSCAEKLWGHINIRTCLPLGFSRSSSPPSTKPDRSLGEIDPLLPRHLSRNSSFFPVTFSLTLSDSPHKIFYISINRSWSVTKNNLINIEYKWFLITWCNEISDKSSIEILEARKTIVFVFFQNRTYSRTYCKYIPHVLRNVRQSRNQIISCINIGINKRILSSCPSRLVTCNTFDGAIKHLFCWYAMINSRTILIFITYNLLIVLWKFRFRFI